MKIVKIYKTKCTKAHMMSEQGEGYSLSPWGINTLEYEGDDDGGREYQLPPGFEIAEMGKSGERGIFRGAQHYHIRVHSSGHPQLVGSDPNHRPVLQMVE